MSDPKKPGAADLDDLRARLGLSKGGGVGSSKPGSLPPPTGAGVPAPPSFAPVAPSAASPVPGPGSGDEDRTDEIDVPPRPAVDGARGSAPPARASAPPARASAPPARASAPPARASTPPPRASSAPPRPSSSQPVVAPPAFAAPGGSAPAPAVSPAVPPPSFGPARQEVSPPPFASKDDGEEEVVREVVVRKLVDDGVPVEDREVGKIRVGPYVAMVATIILAGIFGTMCGSQIDRAVLANRAIGSADAIHAAILQDQEALKNLKSRISGAARLALDKTRPAADLELIDHLRSLEGQQPFTAKVWSGQFYQSFKIAPLMFDYYRQMNALWETVAEVAKRNSEPTTRAAVAGWPDERERIKTLLAADGSSGYGVAFRKGNGKVLAVLGTFKNSHRERDRWQSDFAPLGATATKALYEYQPGFDPLAAAPEDWFVRVNPDNILGQNQLLMSYGGPLVSAAQDPYLQYMIDLNNLSKALSTVQSTQEQLLQSLAEIRQERRPFTFGF